MFLLFLLNTSGLSCRKARWVCSLVDCVWTSRGKCGHTHRMAKANVPLPFVGALQVLLTGCVFITAVEILEIQLSTWCGCGRPWWLSATCLGSERQDVYLGKSWHCSVVETAEICLFCVAEMKRIRWEIGAGDEDVYTGRCYGWVYVVRWGGCLQDMRGGGWGKWLGQQQGNIQCSWWRLFFLLVPQISYPPSDEDSDDSEGENQELAQIDRGKGMKIEGSRDTTAEVSFSFHLCSCKCLLLSPQCTTIRCLLKHLALHRERLVLSDAAVAFLPPEIDIVNHVLKSQCCRDGPQLCQQQSWD